jgi:hypothetical protein
MDPPVGRAFPARGAGVKLVINQPWCGDFFYPKSNGEVYPKEAAAADATATSSFPARTFYIHASLLL